MLTSEQIINYMSETIHQENKDRGWWPAGKHTPCSLTVASKLCLIHSEISEAMEAHRKDLMDDHLPYRKGVEVELADAMVRILDLAGALDLDIGGAMMEKLAYNRTRADHDPANRAKDGGKNY